MRTNFISQSKDDKQKNFWEVLSGKLNLKSSMMKMASKTNIENPREIVKEGLVISYKPNGEYIIKLGHKSDIVVTGVAKQEKELHQHVKRALSYLKSISPAVEAELRTIEAGKRDVLVYVDIDRCRDCVFYESDTSHETYRDKCKNCINATLGGTINNFFPRSQQIVMYAPQWEQIGDTDPKMAFKGTMSLLDAHKKGSADDRSSEMVANEVIALAEGKDAVNLGTSLFKYFQDNKLNFQTYAKPVIESIEKQAGVQIHLRKGKDIILAVDSMRLNPAEMSDTEKDTAGEHIRTKLQSGQDLTDEEQNFLDKWLLVYPKKGVPNKLSGKKKTLAFSEQGDMDITQELAAIVDGYENGQDTISDVVEKAEELLNNSEGGSADYDELMSAIDEYNHTKLDSEKSQGRVTMDESEDKVMAIIHKYIALTPEASKKEKEAPGALSKCDREALDKYEEAKDNITKSKELMPKGSRLSKEDQAEKQYEDDCEKEYAEKDKKKEKKSSFSGTLCLAEVGK